MSDKGQLSTSLWGPSPVVKVQIVTATADALFVPSLCSTGICFRNKKSICLFIFLRRAGSQPSVHRLLIVFVCPFVLLFHGASNECADISSLIATSLPIFTFQLMCTRLKLVVYTKCSAQTSWLCALPIQFYLSWWHFLLFIVFLCAIVAQQRTSKWLPSLFSNSRLALLFISFQIHIISFFSLQLVLLSGAMMLQNVVTMFSFRQVHSHFYNQPNNLHSFCTFRWRQDTWLLLQWPLVLECRLSQHFALPINFSLMDRK